MINTDQQCYVHNVLTCLNCLYDGVGVDGSHFCDERSFINQSDKFKADRGAKHDKLFVKIKAGGDMWVPQ